MSINNPSSILEMVISQFCENGSRRDLQEKLSNYLSENVDLASFGGLNCRNAKIESEIIVMVTKAHLLVTDPSPYLAVFHLSNDVWQLELFMPQCLGCFGTGIMFHGGLCDICGGIGWGDSGYTSFTKNV